MKLQKLVAALSVAAAVGHAQGLRNVVYLDESYQAYGTNQNQDTVKQGLTHVILSFAHPRIFLNGTSATQSPFVTPAELRPQFAKDAHFGLAIGGWGWLDGFAEAADVANRTTFATNVKTYLDTYGFDFVDIDWEYPGAERPGTQQDLPKEKADFPPFLSVLNETLEDKYVTAAVGGKLGDDSTTAFSLTTTTEADKKQQARDIASHVAFFNIMAYDLTNRADTQTGPHTSVCASLAAVQQYLDWGYPASQLNLGFAMYAKHFRTPAGVACATAGGVGCAMEVAQKADGTDTQTSGWLTFEWKNLVDEKAVPEGSAGATGGCGLDIALQSFSLCAGSNCCSKENFCGVGDLYCGAGCQPAFSGGRCAEDLDLRASFAQARRSAVPSETEGAVSYWDGPNRVFWTWETVDMMTRKLDEIVAEKGLGGVFAWNLGQDTFDWAHLLHIKNEAARIAGSTSSAASQVGAVQTSSVLAQAAAQTSYTTPAT